MNKLPISVIVPHYNRPSFLEEAVDSILTQTRPPTEVIVVDDHSTADAFYEITKFRHLARIHRNPKNLGLSETRNVGVRLATCDWVAFLDDDDLYHPRKLALQAAYLETQPRCEVLGGPLLRVTPDGSSHIWGFQEQRQLALQDALLYTASSMCSMMIHRSAYLKLGGMDRSFRQLGDLEFGIRILAAGHRMEILPEPLVTYRHGGRDQMSLQWGKTCRAHLRVINKHRRLYLQEFGPFGALREYARRFQFYGLRRGRALGRSMWGVGKLAQLALGNTNLECAQSPHTQNLQALSPAPANRDLGDAQVTTELRGN